MVQPPPLSGSVDAHLAAIVEDSTAAIIRLGLDGALASWSPAAEWMYGYRAAEVLGRQVSLIVPPDLCRELDDLVARTLSGEFIQGFETVRAREDGSVFEVSISMLAVHGPDGSRTGIALVTRNISAIKESEREGIRFARKSTARPDAEAAAWRVSVLAGVSRVLAESLVDHQPMLERVAQMAAIAADAACVIELFAQGGGPGSFAIDHADRIVRAELGRVFSAPHDLGESPWHELDREFLEGHPLEDALSIRMPGRGATIGVLLLGRFGCDAPLFTDRDREFTYDLATRVALAVENTRLYEDARNAIEPRDTFLTIAAHELKTPLTTIPGYAQLLSLQLNHGLPVDANPVLKSARMIEDNTRLLTRLVEQILDVSRLDMSRMKLDLENVNLAGLIKNLVAGFVTRYDREFRLQLPDRVPDPSTTCASSRSCPI